MRHFGQEIIANRVQLPVGDSKVNVLWLKVYKVVIIVCLDVSSQLKLSAKEFIEAIDAIDNGISQYPTDIKPRYRNRTDLSSRVGALNPWWNQSTDVQTVDVCRIFHLNVSAFSDSATLLGTI